jgi:hypothetical protein
MKPTAGERYAHKTAKLLKYVMVKTGESVPGIVTLQAQSYYWQQENGYYGAPDSYDFGAELCDRLRRMDPETYERLTRDPNRVQEGARLIIWWEEHQEEDRKRQAKASEKRELTRLAKQAMDKLSKEELEALQWRLDNTV